MYAILDIFFSSFLLKNVVWSQQQRVKRKPQQQCSTRTLSFHQIRFFPQTEVCFFCGKNANETWFLTPINETEELKCLSIGKSLVFQIS